MPRYFFHLTDGGSTPDPVGSELPDVHAARIEAVVYAAQTLKDSPEMAWSDPEVKVRVSDEEGKHVFTVRITSSERD